MGCPKCGSEWKIRYGSDGRRFYECSSSTCTFNFHNVSKEILGKYRRHFKLSPSDYVEVHEMFEDYSVSYIANHFGIGLKQVRRILNLNLSDYAETLLEEKGLNISGN